MEAKKQATSSSSSSSLATDLFGPKDSSSSSSSALFDSMFPPPSKAYKRDDISYEQPKKNYESTPKQDCLDNEKNKCQNSKMIDLSAYYEQEVSQPCTLSSSLHYGGQDIYINPHTTKNTPGPGQYSTQNYNNNIGEDDGFATRGNWWQGSLYY
ncbi:hypothetical protein HanPI659440_Chr04g0179931 [Helianthus annuus]|nr:hypothetical protein HanPI659440_Chr04g0179931 [Helianthus annuus]